MGAVSPRSVFRNAHAPEYFITPIKALSLKLLFKEHSSEPVIGFTVFLPFLSQDIFFFIQKISQK